MLENNLTNEETIHLELYDPEWSDKFQREKGLIEDTLGSWIQGGVHHVGSTAVKGLSAKPIVDIMVGIENLEKAKECTPLLESIQYNYSPYKPQQMLWFCKPSPAHREFHLYLMESTHPEWTARLAFRDYLINHSDIAQEYVLLKTKLAKEFIDDREAYTQGKNDFIKSITKLALKEYKN